MLNILANERLKLKRNKLLPVCTLIALMIPIQIIVYAVLSGFVITCFVQKEYVEGTMINTLTVPINRTKFLLGKYITTFYCSC